MEELVAPYVDRISRAIRICAAEHPSDVFSTFALFENAGEGIFAAGLDTLDNSLLQARRREVYIHELRAMMIERDGWLGCCKQLATEPWHPQIHDFNNSFSKFTYPGIVTDRVLEWIGNREITSGHMLWLSWRVIDALLEMNIFNEFRLSAPFRLCFMSMDREDAIVVRMLNWPVSGLLLSS
jgi:hypothetical protein